MTAPHRPDPDALAEQAKRGNSATAQPGPYPWFVEYGIVGLVILVLTLICWQFEPVAGYRLPALVYLFAILLAALRFGRGPVLAMAGLGAIAWNYMFIPPRFTFHVSAAEDIIQLGLFFAIALIMGHLTTQLRTRQLAERRHQLETDALLRVTHSAALNPEVASGLAEALRIINAVVAAETTLILRDLDHSLAKSPHPASTWQPPSAEFEVAARAFASRQPAGRFTATLPQAAATWFPLQTATSVMGVLGVRLVAAGEPLDTQRHELVAALALQLALVLEKDHFIHAVTQAELKERSENLRRSLLDSFSHEFKTPVAVIRAALEAMPADPANPYLAEIDTAARRLQRLIDGLLQMARLESKVVEPQLEWCDVAELVQAALAAAGDVLDRHPLEIRIDPASPLVKTDPSLLTQALANILHNAGVYCPPTTPIEISASCDGRDFQIAVRDHGPGLPPGEEIRIFQKFHRVAGTPGGGTGLGLSIVEGFVRALGGETRCHNHPTGGAVFEIRLQPELLPQQEGDDCLLPPAPEPTRP
jgi:two-component system sensor histidine kinase KdpD